MGSTCGDNVLDCHDSTRCAESRNDKNYPSFVGGQSSSPSLAEGARGWVNTHNDDIAAKYSHLNISIRTLSQSYGKSGRLDSEYYQSKYDAIERKIKDYKSGYCKLESSEIKDANFTPKTQEKIASKIQKSFTLRKVAKDLLESAKFKAENAIKSQ